MDLDVFALDRILLGGKLEPVLVAGLTVEDFEGPPKEIISYVFDYFQNPRYHGKIPTVAAVTRRFPAYHFHRRRESLEWLLDQIRERSDYNYIAENTRKVAAAMGKNDLETARRLIQKAGLEIASRQARTNMVSLTKNMGERKQRYLDRRDKKSMYGIPTGFQNLDALTLGYQPGDFVLCLGRKGCGKTWWGLISAYAAQLDRRAVMFVSREMSVRKLEERYDALHALLPYKAFRRGEIGIVGEKHYFKSLAALREFAPFYVPDFEGKCTPQAIRAKAKDLKCGMVVIDGVYMLDDDSGVRVGWEKHFNIANDIKSGMCKADGMVVLATNQLNRMEEQEKAGLENSAFGDGYGMFCDIALKIVRGSDEVAANMMRMYLLKTREEEMPLQPALLNWNFETMRFNVAGEQHAPNVFQY